MSSVIAVARAQRRAGLEARRVQAEGPQAAEHSKRRKNDPYRRQCSCPRCFSITQSRRRAAARKGEDAIGRSQGRTAQPLRSPVVRTHDGAGAQGHYGVQTMLDHGRQAHRQNLTSRPCLFSRSHCRPNAHRTRCDSDVTCCSHQLRRRLAGIRWRDVSAALLDLVCDPIQ
jgi:hypothetical protein